MTDVQQRLNALEHNARRTSRRLLIGLPATFMAGIGVALLMGSSMTASERIRTKRVELVDATGQTMLALGTDANGGRIDLWTPQGANILRLSGNAHGGDLAVWSTSGTSQAGLWADATGGELAIWNGDGGRLAHVGDSGMRLSGTMRLADTDGRPTMMLSGKHAALTLYDDNNDVSAHLIGGARPRLTLVDEAGSSRLLSDQLTVAHLRADDQGLHIGANDPLLLQANGTITHHGASLTLDGTVTMHAANTSMQLADGALQLDHAGGAMLSVSAIDGHTNLQLAGRANGISMDVAPGEAAISATAARHGSASLSVSNAGAITSLIGPQDTVTLASHASAPVLQTAGGGLSLFADGASGAMELGRGEAGSIRLVAGTDGSVPAIEILDTAGLRAAAMSMEAAGAGAFVAGHGGTPTAVLRGRSGGGRLDLRGEHGTVLIRSGDSPMAALLGPEGRTLAMLAGMGSGGVLNLMDTRGMPVVLTGASAEGRGGAVTYRNADGATVVTAGASLMADGRVQVVDPADQRSTTLAPPRAPTVNAGAMEDK